MCFEDVEKIHNGARHKNVSLEHTRSSASENSKGTKYVRFAH